MRRMARVRAAACGGGNGEYLLSNCSPLWYDRFMFRHTPVSKSFLVR